MFNNADYKIATARFWTRYKGGYVKVSVRIGKKLELFEGQKTDEGFACSNVTYVYDGEKLTQHWSEWGRDCDGRHEMSGAAYARASELSSRPAVDLDTEGKGLEFPAWREIKGSHSQRDYSAEKAGY